MYNYCTLFDKNYLTRGLAMYESMKECSNLFHIYIFAFDDESYQLLIELKLDFATIISLEEFEDEKLLAIKDSRSAGEYCWTCTPSIIKYSLEKYQLESCTYLDADLYFFRNPSILIEEMGLKSVLITEHRYTPKYDRSIASGIYCVQFMTFKNDTNGMKILNWWREACIDWCYARSEDGKFGDQKYLDDWISRFNGVHVLRHLGGGVAPWNVQQYDLLSNEFDLIFYHFHNLKIFENNKVDLSEYDLTNDDIRLLYKPYIMHLDRITAELKNINKEGCYNGIVQSRFFYWKTYLRILRRKINGNYNVFDKEKLLSE